MQKFLGIPGRLEAIPAQTPGKIFIDYAHTPDAFENILSTIKLEEFIQYPDTFDYAFLVFPYKISLSLVNLSKS